MLHELARLPSTSALRIFLAVVRQLNMNKAALELHMSQSAVSQQIRTLEETLGVDLFRRMGRSLVLTEPGQIYAVHASRIIEQLADASEDMRGFHHCGSLTVSVTGPFAHRWLMPRLGSFRLQYPEVNLRFSTSDGPVEFAAQDIDIAVRYGSKDQSNHISSSFLCETIFPVCTPAVNEKYGPFENPADILRAPLLVDGSEANAIVWGNWFLHCGLAPPRGIEGVTIQDTGLLLQAVAAGHGIALARGALVADDLQSGLLVKLFDHGLLPTQHYQIIEPRTTVNRTKPNKLKQWLCDEAALQVSNDRYGAVSLPSQGPTIIKAYDHDIPNPRPFHARVRQAG